MEGKGGPLDMTNTNMSVYTIRVCVFIFNLCLFVCMHVHIFIHFLVKFPVSVCWCHFCVSLVITVWSGFQTHAHDVSVIKASGLTDRHELVGL